MKAYIDDNVCTGCGLCPETCPEVFEMTDDVATVRVPEVPSAAMASCRQARDECPVEAISIKD